jgi:hypothetical protein
MQKPLTRTIVQSYCLQENQYNDVLLTYKLLVLQHTTICFDISLFCNEISMSSNEVYIFSNKISSKLSISSNKFFIFLNKIYRFPTRILHIFIIKFLYLYISNKISSNKIFIISQLTQNNLLNSSMNKLILSLRVISIHFSPWFNLSLYLEVKISMSLNKIFKFPTIIFHAFNKIFISLTKCL